MSVSFKADGYTIARGLFSVAEAEQLREHYMAVRHRNPRIDPRTQTEPGDSRDPLRRYPRLGQMHRWDETSLRWLLDQRIRDQLVTLLGAEPYAVQSMLYFKPAGSRGQALHQDNFYLKVEPGTCMAAWMALDRTDEDNGCMRVVPGSHEWPVLCTEKADTKLSFTDVTVPLPSEHDAVPVPMEPGDVLFFNGSLVHGSFPNSSTDRFRRALIGHYVQAEAEKVAEYYHPVLRMDGTTLRLDVSEGGGECGRWVDENGQPAIEMTGQHRVVRKHE